MLRFVARALAALLGLLVLLGVGGFVYVRYVLGASVNVPLAQYLPGVSRPHADAKTLAQHLTLAPGLALSVYARGIKDARMLRATRTGDLLVASPSTGAVWLLAADANHDGAADGVRLLLHGLDGPNGLDFHAGYLYVAEEGRVGRIAFDHVAGAVSGRYEVLIDGLPRGGNHWKKTLRFGPDGKLYLAVGSSCNVCLEADARRAALLRFEPDGRGGTTVATGLRNTAGFDWRPEDGGLYATDNGRDMLGDDFPACELNRIEAGGFYGWPFANTRPADRAQVPDPDFGAGHAAEIARTRAPVYAFRAHNAPLGILFPRRGALPPAYAGAALVALHGSWNRAEKDGYKVVSLHWGANGRIEARDFVSGFVAGGSTLGRPAELAEDGAGAIYVSDDLAGAVYRVAAGEGSGVRADAGVPPEPDAETLARVQDDGGGAAPATGAASASQAKVDGARLFAGAGCTECHRAPGSAGAANAAAAPAKIALTGLGARYDAASLQAYLQRPRPPMPPVQDARERAALAGWLLQVAR